MRRVRVIWWLAAGISGGIAFWLFQLLTSPSTIPEFMGEQIVAQGEYPKALTLPIGWGVHLGVSLSYSLLFAVIIMIPFTAYPSIQLVVGALIALALGWITTLLTAPAIAVTISVLSGQGFPDSLPGLNKTFGLPFWNHVFFFGVVWAIYLVIPTLSSHGSIAVK